MNKEVEVYFDHCSPEVEYVRYVDWMSEIEILTIERENISPCEHLFNVIEEKRPSTSSKVLRVGYKPMLPNADNIEYFTITHEGGAIAKLLLRGTTVGPDVICKATRFIVNCNTDEPVKNMIQLTNQGKMDAIYQFDVDNNNTDLIVSQSKGSILKGKTTYVTVTYHPTRPAFVFRKMVCLVHLQEPIVITMWINFQKESAFREFDDFLYFRDPLPTYPNNYESFIQDVSTKLFEQSIPIITLDKQYIDFGWTNPMQYASQSFIVTNHSLVKLTITWFLDNCTKFDIQPRNAEVFNGCTTVFKAIFKPPFSDQLYGAMIIGKINWGSNNDFVVPFPISISFLGHTFSAMRTSWDPIYLMLQKIILPATVPEKPSYRTFKIENTGQFPLMFKFSPPSISSNVTIKPLHGLIEKNSFQICAIRLFPGVKTDTYYSEKWKLEINISQKIEIEITTTAELPYIIIYDNKMVKFPCTNKGSFSTITVPVKNKTRLTLKYELVINEPDIPFFGETNDNIIKPNELMHIKLHYCPTTYGLIISYVYFKLTCIKPDLPQTYTSTITTIRGKCEKVIITAIPKYLYLGEILVGNWAYGEFAIRNHSKCAAYIDTDCTSRTFGDEDVLTKLEPKSMVIPTQSLAEVKVSLCPRKVGIKEMKITYRVCTDETLQTYVDETSDDLLVFDAYCSTPLIKVIDLRVSRNQPTLAKYFIWRKLQINNLNDALKTLNFLPDAPVVPIYMKLPVGVLDSDPIAVDLLIQNCSAVQTTIEFEYIKTCTCQLVYAHVSMTFKKLIKNCKHGQQITFSPEKSILKPKEEKIVTLKCIYTDNLRKTFKYNLYVRATKDTKISGSIILLFERNCTTPEKSFLDFNHPTSLITTVILNVCPVFVGDTCKPMQAIWTYNNCPNFIHYKVEVDASEELQIFEFPQTHGEVPPYTAYPILFKFSPYQFKTYIKDFNLITNDVNYTLHMIGEGRIFPCFNTYCLMNKVPNVSLFPESKEDIDISLDMIVIYGMLLHTTVKRMLFLKNNTNQNIQFLWSRRRFGAMFELNVIPQNGILKPYQLLPCQVVIQSLSLPSKFTIIVTCKFIYIDQIKVYSEKVEHTRKAGPLFDSSFIHYKDYDFNPVKVEMKSKTTVKKSFFTIAVCVQSISERNIDLVIPNVKNQMKMMTHSKIDFVKSINPLSKDEAYICIEILSRSIWEVLNRKFFQETASVSQGVTYYSDMADCKHILPLIEPPKHLVVDILHKALTKELLGMFEVKTNSGWDTITTKESIEDDNDKSLEIRNKYYKEILKHGYYHIVSQFDQTRTSSDEDHPDKLVKFLRKSTFYR